MKDLDYYIKKNNQTGEFNEWVFGEFTSKAVETEFLIEHRKYIETNELGFGCRAHHFMWLLVLRKVFTQTPIPKLLEIGVFKGQIISLWSLIGKIHDQSVEIHGISPFEGNYIPPRTSLGKLFSRLDPRIRRKIKEGNLYQKADFLEIIKLLFEHFQLDFKSVKLYKGFSSDSEILNALERNYFDIIYIDGDHSLKGCKNDIVNYSEKLKPGGFLIMDDASCNIPGGESGKYWKGHQAVSDACETIPQLGFSNLLNVSHNRIYRKNVQ